MPQLRDSNGVVIHGAFAPGGLSQNVAYTASAGTIAQPIGTTQASGTITSDNTAPADGSTVTIGNKTYTFKTSLTPTEGEVLINSTADAALLNLIRAINHTGTPNTDYKCAAAHTQVSAAAAVSSHAFAVTALIGGTAGNVAFATTGTSHITFSGSALSGGVSDRSVRQVMVMCTTVAFIAVSTAGTSATTAGFPIAAGVPTVIPVGIACYISAIRSAADGTLYVVELD